jgi:hypothetical protein
MPDGRLEVRYKGRSMPYRTFDRLRRVTETAVLENKRLGGLLALIRQDQQAEPLILIRSASDSYGLQFAICVRTAIVESRT